MLTLWLAVLLTVGVFWLYVTLSFAVSMSITSWHLRFNRRSHGIEQGLPLVAGTEQWRPGDWLNIQFGYDRMNVYVWSAGGGKTWFSTAGWLAGPREFLENCGTDWAELLAPVYLGRSSKLWYWRFLPTRSLCPPYKLPERVLEYAKEQGK